MQLVYHVHVINKKVYTKLITKNEFHRKQQKVLYDTTLTAYINDIWMCSIFNQVDVANGDYMLQLIMKRG